MHSSTPSLRVPRAPVKISVIGVTSPHSTNPFRRAPRAAQLYPSAHEFDFGFGFLPTKPHDFAVAPVWFFDFHRVHEQGTSSPRRCLQRRQVTLLQHAHAGHTQGGAANAGWRWQVRIRGPRHRSGVAEL